MTAFGPALLLLLSLPLPAAAGQAVDDRAAQGGGVSGLHFESVFDGYKPVKSKAPKAEVPAPKAPAPAPPKQKD